MESCNAYRPWYDKKTGDTTLKPTSGKCLHYYFYFIDESFGLCYVRVPTWAPFRLQVYFNGHNWLAQRLEKAGIAFKMADNAFAVRCRSRAGTDDCQATGRQTASSTTESMGEAILPGTSALPRRLPPELDAGGIRHRRRLPSISRIPATLRRHRPYRSACR
jgi:hypothetical protein